MNDRALFLSENQHKEDVYETFDKIRSKINASVKNSQSVVDAESYEDQDSWIAHSELGIAKRKRSEAESMIEDLYARPYFSHIEIIEEGELESDHYYLSDCERLDHLVSIENGGNLIPFKQDKERPFFVALFHAYQQKKGDLISYRGNKGFESAFYTTLICDTDILNRELKNVIQLYPELSEITIDADELLDQKLQENRNNPTLQNIISTLQRKQFQIIEADENESFVVQGCAGSGKSQCMLHRLFFLRDVLSEDRWSHVLLITPTQLFRNYSSELMQRFQLSDIENCSIAELYRTILETYDPRFKNRQYHFELTEEYLPDIYLQKVYDVSTITRIESEIDEAVKRYVSEACIEINVPILKNVDATQIQNLISAIDDKMNDYDFLENSIQNYSEYTACLNAYKETQENLISTQESLDQKQSKIEKVYEDIKRMNSLIKAVDEVRNAEAQWLKENIGTEKCNENNEYVVFCEEYYDLVKGELTEFTKGRQPKKFMNSLKNKFKSLSQQIQKTENRLYKLSLECGNCEDALYYLSKAINNSDYERIATYTHDSTLRSRLNRVRYFLTRIESTVFEQEVWNALAPLKKECGIQTLHIEELPNGKKKESRILYKSDLLFYIRIYLALHQNTPIPQYSLLCIDEGQDLHKADYDLLRSIYTKAAFNIFGDINQVLHSSCGIKDWENETGLNIIYPLIRNYRNTAAIVDFCNSHFGTKMDYIGHIQDNQKPIVIEDIKDCSDVLHNSMIVIVRGKEELSDLCNATHKHIGDFEYLDTKSSKPTGEKITCYSIFAAKGLEFQDVLVYAKGMTNNQKVVACTRAMQKLFYCEG